MSAWQPLPWQQDRWQRVIEAVAAERLGHALLLAGPRGVGKGHFAHGLAGYLLCEGAQKPCGECRSCVQLAAGVHPNLLRLAPAEDKRDIAIDDIRALLERVTLSSHYGQAKVVIVEPADALNASGVNALLKTIEEPPPRTHVLFVAERWCALPPTLRSRCQILRFAPPPAPQALAWLKAQHPAATEPALRPLLRAPLLAAARLEAEAAERREEWGRALLELLEGRVTPLRLTQGLKREAAQAALEQWLTQASGALASTLVPERAAGAALPRGARPEVLQRLLDDLVEGLRALERNASPALLVESIMIRLSERAAAGR